MGHVEGVTFPTKGNRARGARTRWRNCNCNGCMLDSRKVWFYGCKRSRMGGKRSEAEKRRQGGQGPSALGNRWLQGRPYSGHGAYARGHGPCGGEEAGERWEDSKHGDSGDKRVCVGLFPRCMSGADGGPELSECGMQRPPALRAAVRHHGAARARVRHGYVLLPATAAACCCRSCCPSRAHTWQLLRATPAQQ